MTHILEAPAAVIDALTAGGLRATGDPRNAHPPCVVVELGTADRTARCRVDCTVTATLLAPGAPNADALAALDSMHATAAAALDADGLPWTAGQLVTYAAPTTGDPLPAYELTIPITLED